MKRTAAYLILVLLSLWTVVPTMHQSGVALSAGQSSTIVDPQFQLNATLAAFNSTLAHFDLYTISRASISPLSNGTLSTFSKFNNTANGLPVPGTGFNYTIPPSTVDRKEVNFTLIIPSDGRPKSSQQTYVRFGWNGTAKPGTEATYFLYNSTIIFNANTLVRRISHSGNFTGSPSNVTATVTGPPVTCGATDECFDVTRFFGYNLTLTFLFNSTMTGGGFRTQVSNIQVASISLDQVPSSAHWMFVNNADADEIIHYAKMPLNYTSVVSYLRPHTTNQYLNHTWGQVILTLYWPTSYALNNVTIIGGNQIFPTASPSIPLSQGPCIAVLPSLSCTNAFAVSLNMTSPALNRVALFVGRSVNAVASIRTTMGASDTGFWTPGENATVRVINQPGVGVQGSQAAWLTSPPSLGSPNGVIEQNRTLSQSVTGGTSNYTIVLPTSPLGNWTLTVVFSNRYDYGSLSHQFRIDEMQIEGGTSPLPGTPAPALLSQ